MFLNELTAVDENRVGENVGCHLNAHAGFD